MLACTMEEFDFNEPVNAVVIFDDSDDEPKPAIDTKEGECTNNSIKTIQELKIIEKKIENDLSKTRNNIKAIEIEISNSSTKTGTLENIKDQQNNLETTRCVVAKTHSSNSKKAKNDKTNQNLLDIMFSLGEENVTLQSFDGSINEHTNNKEMDRQHKTDYQIQDKRKKAIINLNKITKKLRTEKINSNMGPNRVEIQEHCSSSTKTNQNGLQIFNQDQSKTEMLASVPQKQNNEREKRYAVNIEINPNFNHQQLNTDVSMSQSINKINKTVANYLKELLNTVSEHMIYILNSYYTYMRMYRTSIDRNLIELARNNFLRTKYHFFHLSYSSILNIIISEEKDTTFVKNFLTSTMEIAHSKSYTYSYTQIESLYIEMIHWAKNKREEIQNITIDKMSTPVLLQQSQTQLPHNKPQPPYLNQVQQFHKHNGEVNKNCMAVSVPLERNINVEPTYPNKENGTARLPVIMPPQYTQEYYANQTYNTQSKRNTSYRPLESLQTLLNFRNLQPTHNLNNIQNVASSWEKGASQSWQNNEPTTQNVPQNHQEPVLLQNNQYLRPENPTQNEPNRSSISRDSGFISPLNFNSSCDQSYNLQEEQSSQRTPLITHVTSLNPNVSYIIDGYCTVCGKSTKKKCLGCYKCYYCSHDCQYFDWKNHMAVCK